MEIIEDSMSSTIDTAFFDQWSLKVIDESYFNKFETAKIIDAFINRTKALNYPVQTAKFRFRKSVLKTINGEYNDALKIIEEIIPVFEKENNLIFLGACYNSSGGILATIGDISGGIERLEKAMLYTKQSNGTPSIKNRAMSNHYNVLGTIYFKNKQFDKALENFELTYKIAKEHTPYGSTERCYSLINLSHALIRKKEFKKGYALAEKSLVQAKVGKNKDLICYSYHRKGLALEGLGQFDSAMHYFNLMETLAKKYKYNLLIGRAHLHQYQLFKTLGKTDLALEKHENYSNLKIEEEKEKNKTLTNYLITQTQKSDEEKALAKLAKEKVKQRNLQLIAAVLIGTLLLLILGFYFWIQRKRLNQQLKDEQAKLDLMQSQMRTIQSQMNPHFIFNALNSVQDLIMQKEIRSSNIYLGKFAELMRRTLDSSEKDSISIFEEIEMLTLYLEIEKLRFEEDFEYWIECNFSNEEQQLEQIPAMLLQPYVENAIKHGLLHKKGKKKLTIQFIKEENNSLSCHIIDNGVGRVKSGEINQRRSKFHKSFAMKANQKRMDLINESAASHAKLSIFDIIEGDKIAGTKVSFLFNA